MPKLSPPGSSGGKEQWSPGGYQGTTISDELAAIAECANWHRLYFWNNAPDKVYVGTEGAPAGESEDHYISSFEGQYMQSKSWLAESKMIYMQEFTSAKLEKEGEQWVIQFS